ncbi:MAG TPA: OmpA family protein, partial [Bacteroidia bacterium]|nr:OmpA family protein [Bacteroidia bacterium]
SELRPYSNTELNKLYEFLVNHPDLAIEIAGYTDSKGTDDYNIALSKARAAAVVNYLKQKGIEEKRLTAAAHGESDPIAPNKKADGSDDPDGRQLNRRVELKIIDVK